MSLYAKTDPIIACSGPRNINSAIGIIRLSGFRSLSIIQPFISKKVSLIRPRFMHQLDLLDNQKVVDNIMFCFYEAPNSYNGENIVELFVHGNKINIRTIIDLFKKDGVFRDAAPGEFTMRAFRNKKLNLSQVEGLDLLLNANSGIALKQGLELLHGDLNKKYLQIYSTFIDLKSSLELMIDFSEDYGEEEVLQLFRSKLDNLVDQSKYLYDRAKCDSSALLSPSIVLIGETNAGKSTFFNNFLNNSRSIVSCIEGTTRDYISELAHIDGNDYRIIDTAGIRNTTDQIEIEGIKRTLDLIEGSFFKILVVNPASTKTDLIAVKDVHFDLVVITRGDLLSEISKFNLSGLKIKYSNVIYVNQTGPIGAENSGSIGAENSGSIGAENSGSIGAETSGSIGAETSGSIGAET
ncbi:MAG: GTP-binding protein, partial [Bdellovibrionales bacterium]|nr:GTP-binding protein [Bdellovibrionales bacterium]